MTSRTTLAVEISTELDAQLDALAAKTDRTKARIVEGAIAAFIEAESRETELIRGRVEEARTGTPGIPHDEVARWVRSWGTEHELEMPQPRRRS